MNYSLLSARNEENSFIMSLKGTFSSKFIFDRVKKILLKNYHRWINFYHSNDMQ
jgi:hypothetical protein